MIENIKTSAIYTTVNLTGSFLPFLTTCLIMLIYDYRLPSLLSLAGKGEISIICIPLCISVCYTLYFFKKEVGCKGWHSLLFWLTLFFLVVAVFIYAAGVREFYKTQMANHNLLIFSLIFAGWSSIAMFFSQVISNKSTSINESRNNDQKKLDDRFNEII